VQEFHEGELTVELALGFRDFGELGLPLGDQLLERLVIDKTDVKFFAAMIDDGFHGEVDVRLVEIVTAAGTEAFPNPGIICVFGVNPQLGLVESVKGIVV